MDDILDDGNDVSTALRETYEEVGIESHHVEVLSRMSTIESKHSLCVTPIVGWIRQSHVAEPRNLYTNPREVETAFAVPLRYFADPNNVVHEERVVWRGEDFAMRTFHYYDDDRDMGIDVVHFASRGEVGIWRRKCRLREEISEYRHNSIVQREGIDRPV